MKIAVISSGDPYNMKGIMNFVWEKVRRLSMIDDLEVDYYVVRTNPSIFNSILLRCFKGYKSQPADKKQKFELINGIRINYLWFTRTLYDQFILKFIDRNPIPKRTLSVYAQHFKNYDILVTHTPDVHTIALYCKKHYNKPYITTWHGSDINILPHSDNKIVPILKDVIENACVNYFVSNHLLKQSTTITLRGNKQVYYTGPAEGFIKYDELKKEQLKYKHNCLNKKIVAFVGSIIAIKNVEILPDVFQQIRDKYNQNIEFWVIGNGNLESMILSEFTKRNLQFRIFKNVNPIDMPDFMNCIDVLVLPSKNEGLGLVLLEAIKCGAAAVGSNIGGIPEVVGKENAFDLDENFEDKISDRIVFILNHPEYKQSYESKFSWENAIQMEVEAYKKYCI